MFFFATSAFSAVSNMIVPLATNEENCPGVALPRRLMYCVATRLFAHTFPWC